MIRGKNEVLELLETSNYESKTHNACNINDLNVETLVIVFLHFDIKTLGSIERGSIFYSYLRLPMISM